MRFRFAFLIAAPLLLQAGAHPKNGVVVRHGHEKTVVVKHRPVYTEVRWRGSHYFYRDGYCYRRGHRGYFIVSAPLGIVVPFLPLGAVVVHARHSPFHYYGGVYYRQIPEGYVVVSKPDTVIVREVQSERGKTETEFVEAPAETVMVGNSNGSKTPVRLEKVGGQWKGPRGELYDSEPTNEQLRPVYGF